MERSEALDLRHRHKKADYAPWCLSCAQDFPCPTIRLLDENTALRERIRELEADIAEWVEAGLVVTEVTPKVQP